MMKVGFQCLLKSLAISINCYLVKIFYIFLPPANEVWGKVIFLHLSVILFTGESVPLHNTHPLGRHPSPWIPQDSQQAGFTYPTRKHTCFYFTLNA